MEVKDIVVPYTRSKNKKRLYALGCAHYGTVHCLEHELDDMIYKIAHDDDCLGWIEMGDSAEFIVLSDKRSDTSGLADWMLTREALKDIAGTQAEYVAMKYRSIAKKCVGKISGNHEVSVQLHYNKDVQGIMCEKMGVTDLGYSAFLRLYFKRENSSESHLATGAFTHGSSGATTIPGKVGALVKFMDNFSGCHFYGYGHVHAIVTDIERVYLSCQGKNGGGRIKDFVAKGALTGAWFTTYTKGSSSYGERKNYNPTNLGCVVYEFEVEDSEVKITIRKA